MAENLELFTVAQIGERIVYGNTCTPAPVGTGPGGETCKSCLSFRRIPYHGATYLKCGKMESSWSHGNGTDIRAGWPACREWNELPQPHRTEE